jgi:phosphocarrier protein
MYSKQTVLKNRTGLHARPASEFVACAKAFESKVTVRRLDVEDEKQSLSHLKGRR